MPHFSGQIIFVNVRRVLEFISFVIFIVLIFTLYSQWALKSNDYGPSNVGVSHSFYWPQGISNNEHIHNESPAKLNYGRPDLPKYIHLDLKGAPPKADKFYVPFFNFLEKIDINNFYKSCVITDIITKSSKRIKKLTTELLSTFKAEVQYPEIFRYNWLQITTK